MSETELQPDPGEVLQEEGDDQAVTVPVCVEYVSGPVRTQALPRKAGATRTRSVSNVVPWRALAADHRRATATLVSGTAFLVAFSETSAQDDGTMSWWPANVPLTVGCDTEVWVKVSGDAAADVSVISEWWAAG